jgi:hypothetical protein
MKGDNRIIQPLLILLLIVNLYRTSIFFISKEFIKNKEGERINDLIAIIFSVVRLLLVSMVLFLRGIKNDILSYVLIYSGLNSLLRFYYEYTLSVNSKSKQIIYLTNVLQFNAVSVFISSLYFIYYILVL